MTRRIRGQENVLTERRHERPSQTGWGAKSRVMHLWNKFGLDICVVSTSF
jgi:hypothetical protein